MLELDRINEEFYTGQDLRRYRARGAEERLLSETRGEQERATIGTTDQRSGRTTNYTDQRSGTESKLLDLKDKLKVLKKPEQLDLRTEGAVQTL